jgi:hypothetical protein
MRRISYFAIFGLFLLLTAVNPALAADVIDGVVATVNHRPIFQSDWDEAIRFEAFMRQKPLSQVSQTDKVGALQRLIDRQLIEAQMGDPRSVQPSEEELREDLAKLQAQVAGGKNEPSWQKVLAGYELTEPVMIDHLRTEVQVMNFIDVRLRPNVRIQPDEIEAYYENQVLPDLQKVGAKVVSLNEAEPKIRELLTQQHMDQLLEVWLHNLRQQAQIHSVVQIPAANAPTDDGQASGSE